VLVVVETSMYSEGSAKFSFLCVFYAYPSFALIVSVLRTLKTLSTLKEIAMLFLLAAEMLICFYLKHLSTIQ
jgi:hypothetical protein